MFSFDDTSNLRDYDTTVMLRNLPRTLTLPMLLQKVTLLMPSADYDFAYLPWQCRRDSNMTIAVINFKDHPTAQLCMQKFNNLPIHVQPPFARPKYCRPKRAHVQGLVDNLATFVATYGFQNLDQEHAPQVYQNGHQVSLQDAIVQNVTVELLQRAQEYVALLKPHRMVKHWSHENEEDPTFDAHALYQPPKTNDEWTSWEASRSELLWQAEVQWQSSRYHQRASHDQSARGSSEHQLREIEIDRQNLIKLLRQLSGQTYVDIDHLLGQILQL